MKKLKQTKIYKPIKKFFFVVVHFALKTNRLKNWLYYYSKWVTDNGDETLLAKYPLNSNSTVVDIGGYKGFFSDKIISLYDPSIFILEPINKYFRLLKNKYKDNKKVKVYNFGLSDKNSYKNIYLSDDGSSLIKKSKALEKVRLVDCLTFIKKFKSVDLISLNIEGSEYKVLERLVSTNLIKRLKFLQVQFHNFVPNAKELRTQIVKKISRTHKKRYSYPFIWESFESKQKDSSH